MRPRTKPRLYPEGTGCSHSGCDNRPMYLVNGKKLCPLDTPLGMRIPQYIYGP